jgi:hypothetical protein
MGRRIEIAGPPERCFTHGLQLAPSRRLAQAGCSNQEIVAITRLEKRAMNKNFQEET